MFLSLDTIRQHILEEILNDEERDLKQDQDLLLSGILDSLSVLRLIAWLEKKCQLSIPAVDVTVENFGTLQQIMQYLHSRES